MCPSSAQQLFHTPAPASGPLHCCSLAQNIPSDVSMPRPLPSSLSLPTCHLLNTTHRIKTATPAPLLPRPLVLWFCLVFVKALLPFSHFLQFTCDSNGLFSASSAETPVSGKQGSQACFPHGRIRSTEDRAWAQGWGCVGECWKGQRAQADDSEADGKGLECRVLGRDPSGLREGTSRDRGGQGSWGSRHEQRALT